jgi:two-component system phosphate regulon sensor histidine kinase PhoR
MAAKRRWLWVMAFAWVAFLMALLAAGWNFVLVQDYRQIVALARAIVPPGAAPALSETRPPWAEIVFGTLGFLFALGTMAGFFVKLLNEMRLNQLQAEFLAAISHELKTPIASLELTSSLIRGGGNDAEEVARLWESHDAELKRLKEEVETLLEAARWRAHSAKIACSTVDIETWLAASMERWRKIIGPGGQLIREGDPLPGSAQLDERTLWLICDNLVDNARKFSKGLPIVRLRTTWTPLRGNRAAWRMEFSDEGWGFNPKDTHHLFDPFYRAKHSERAIPGNGLGLYLAASACRAMGLKLKGHSDGVGHGATFTVEGKAKISGQGKAQEAREWKPA